MTDLPGPKNTAIKNGIFKYYIIITLSAGLLYVISCSRAILWQDSGLFVYRILHNDIEGKLGIALSHPLYILVGIAVKYIPLGELAYRINLISAVAGAFTVANLFLLVYLCIGRIFPAVISAISLGLSWTFWQHTAIAETYTLCAAQIFTELIVLVMFIRTRQNRYLYLLGLLNGLTIANHLWGVFGFLCYTIFLAVLLVRRQIKVKQFLLIVLLWMIGASPYEYLVIKNIVLTGDLTGTINSALFGTMWHNSVLNASITPKIIIENIIFILLNFPTPNFLLFFAGLWAVYKRCQSRALANVLTAMLLLHFIFAFRYTVPDRYAFFLPFYCLAAFFIGFGADLFFERFKNKALIYIVIIFSLLPLPTYFFTPAIGKKFYPPLGQRRQRPYRDEYVYFLQPWKTGYNGCARFAEEALELTEKDSILYAYTTDVHALLYMQQVRGIRPDVKIVSDYDKGKNTPILNEDTIDELLKTSPVYVTSIDKGYYPSFLSQGYQFVPVNSEGIAWKVVKRTE